MPIFVCSTVIYELEKPHSMPMRNKFYWPNSSESSGEALEIMHNHTEIKFYNLRHVNFKSLS